MRVTTENDHTIKETQRVNQGRGNMYVLFMFIKNECIMSQVTETVSI